MRRWLFSYACGVGGQVIYHVPARSLLIVSYLKRFITLSGFFILFDAGESGEDPLWPGNNRSRALGSKSKNWLLITTLPLKMASYESFLLFSLFFYFCYFYWREDCVR